MNNTVHRSVVKILYLFLSLFIFGNTEVLSQSSGIFNTETPLFIKNRGQVSDQHGNRRSDILYTFQSRGVSVFVTSKGLHYMFSRSLDGGSVNDKMNEASKNAVHRIDLILDGANRPTNIRETFGGSYYHNYFNLPGIPEGIKKVETVTKIVFENIYENIDWVVYVNGASIKYDFVVRYGGDFSQIKMRYEGADRISIEDNGNLLISSSLGTIQEEKPKTFLEGYSAEVKSAFRADGNVISFSADVPADFNSTLTIDPGIVWSTYFGGANADAITRVKKMSNSRLAVCGYTGSVSNIATIGAYRDTLQGQHDVYVAVFTGSGTLLWASYFGGTLFETANSISIDPDDNIFVSGYTYSKTGIQSGAVFSATPPAGSVSCPFIAKFTDSGFFEWGTFYNGTSSGVIRDGSLATDKSGNVYFGGTTSQTSGIAFNGYQNTRAGGGNIEDFFIVKFSAKGARLWGTYYGGNSTESYGAIATDDSGYVYLAGTTTTGFGLATAGVFQIVSGGGNDGIIAKFDSSGKKLVKGSYFGGAGYQFLVDVQVAADGCIYFAGQSQDPTLGHKGFYDSMKSDFGSFIVKFTPDFQRSWSGYMPGQSYANLDLSDNYLFFYAETFSQNSWFYRGADSSSSLSLLSKVDTAGRLVYSTNIFKSGIIYDIEALADSEVIVAGLADTFSYFIYTKGNVHQQVSNGDYEGFLALFKEPRISGISMDTVICSKDSVSGTMSFTDSFSAYNVVRFYMSDSSGSFTNRQFMGASEVSGVGATQFKFAVPAVSSSHIRYKVLAVSDKPYDSIIFEPGIRILKYPRTNLLADSPFGCTGDTVHLAADTIDIVSYFWYKDSVLLNQNTPSLSVTNSGKFYAVMQTGDGCIGHTETKTIDVFPRPRALFSPANDTACMRAGVVKFKNHSSISDHSSLDYLWDFGDLSTSFDSFPVKKYSAPGVYSVKLTATSLVNGCRDTMRKEMVFVEGPVSSFVSQIDACERDNKFQLINISVPQDSLTYFWDFGDGTTSDSIFNPLVRYKEDGIYDVKLVTQKVNGCIDTMIRTLTVYPAPDIKILVDKDTQCFNGHRFRFIDSTKVIGGFLTETKWFVGDSVFMNKKNMDYAYPDSGHFEVKVIAKTDRLCTDTAIRIVTVFREPDVSYVVSGANLCKGNITIQCLDTAPYMFYRWYRNGSKMQGETSSLLRINESGRYHAIVSTYDFCRDTSQDTLLNMIDVPQKPVINKAALLLEVASGYTSYAWYFNNSIISGAGDFYYEADKNGFYKVRVFNAFNCDAWSDSVEIRGLSVSRFDASMLTLFPNPNSGIFELRADRELSKIQLTDIAGRCVQSFISTQRLFDISHLSPGVYYLNVSDESSRNYSIKVVKL